MTLKKLPKFSQSFWEVIFILIVGLIPLLWYKEGFIGFGHDMGFPLAPIDHFLDRLYTWTDRLGPFGSDQIQVLPGFFIHGLEALLSSIGLSLVAVQKITYIFWFVLPGITMYILLRYLHPEKEDYSIRLTGSLFYMMNHYLLQAWTIAERTKFSIVAALPLVVLLVIKVLHKKESPVKNSLLFALILFFLNGGEGIPLIITLFLVVLVTAVTFFFLSDESFWFKTKRLLIFSLLSLFFWTLLSSYWLFPYLKSYNQTFGQRFDEAWGTAGAVSWNQGISVNTSWINLFKLRGIPDWFDNVNHPYSNEFLGNPFLLFLNILFPALVLVSLLNIKKLPNLLFKTRIYFLVLLLIAIPLSAGSHFPSGIFYDYLLVNLPGFVLFRSGFFKFGMIIWFVYAYLVAVGFKQIMDWSKAKFIGRYKEYGALVLFATFVISLFIYNYPFLTGSFFNYAKDKTTMVKVPDYVLQTKKELDSNKFSTRTLLMPNSDIRTEYIEYDWMYFSLIDLPQAMSRKSTVRNDVLARSNERDLIESMLSEYKQFGNSNLMRFTGINKAIVQNDFLSPDYEGNILSGVEDSFKKSQDFTFNHTLGKWDFYNYNKESIPQIYSPSKIVSVTSIKSDLSLAANVPGAFDEDGFVLTDSLEDNSKDEIFNRTLTEAKCGDCPSVDNYQIFFSTSKIMVPGTIYYKLGKYVTDTKKFFASSPNAKLDMNLSNSTTLISDLGALQSKDQVKGIKVAVKDLKQNIKEMRANLDKIPDSKDKKETLRKIRFFVSFFLYYESQWATSAQPGVGKSELTNLETELNKFNTDVDKEIGETKLVADDKLYKYILDINQTGDYDFYVYKQSAVSNQITLSVDGRILSANKTSPNWYKITKVSLKDTPSVIEITKSQSIEERPIIYAELERSTPNFISPNIEFVALNQTKYLVRTSGSGQFLLGFNSRFDRNWTLREVNSEQANKYFVGEIRSSLNGKVIEYQRADNHIITDIVFPDNKTKIEPAFELNGFSNGWIVNSNENSSGKTFLLEYNSQNDFYKAAAVSVISFIAISLFYIIKYARNKH